MITISLCMIVKNEESVLERCLSSVADVMDEIIIVDTGSTDRTKEIAKKFTDKVYDFEWVEDFSKARNYAYDLATMDYQMWLDADDIMLPEEKEKLRALKNELSEDVDMVVMKYNTNFDKDGKPILTSNRERLTKRSKNFRWQEPVHECIPLTANYLQADITITHQKEDFERTSGRNLKIYEALEQSGKPMNPRQQYYFARELKDHGQLEKAVHYFEMFLDGKAGWVEDNIATCFNLAVCYNGLGQEDKILPILIKSFEYDTPRAEICCELGYYYKRRRQYQKAIDWFFIATCLQPTNSLGFILKDYWGFIPNIELCVCYYQIDDKQKSKYYNEQAALFKPNSTAVKKNRKLFS